MLKPPKEDRNYDNAHSESELYFVLCLTLLVLAVEFDGFRDDSPSRNIT